MLFHFGCPLTGVCVGVETGICEGGRKLSSPLTRVSVESFHSMKIINHIPLTSRSHSRSHIPSQSHQRSSSQRTVTFKNDFFLLSTNPIMLCTILTQPLVHARKYINSSNDCRLNYIHFEITGDRCYLIGSQQCDLFTNHTIFLR